MATSLRCHVPFSLQSNPRGATQAPRAGKLDTCAMERVALLRTSGRRFLHRCRRGRPVVQAAVSSSARCLPATAFPSRGYSALPGGGGGGARFLAAAAPLHCAGRYWPAAAPRLARRLSVPAVSTSPSPVPQGEN
jgi:presequence protease